MAYKYRQNFDTSDGYIKYDISPDFDKPFSVGDTITVTGQAYCSGMTIKDIGVFMRASGEIGANQMVHVEKTISKGKTGTFTATFTISQIRINLWFRNYSYDTRDVFLSFAAFNAVDQSWSDARYAEEATGLKYTAIKVRSSPSISVVDFTDSHAAISGTDTPLDYFGGYIAGQSLPTLTATFSTDSRDQTLTTTHHLVVTDSGNNVIFDGTTTAAALAVDASINLPAIAAAGTYTYTWTVTDSAGLSDDETGTFTVLAYSPPSITAFILARYRHDSVSGTNVAADNGTLLWLDLQVSISSVESKNAWTMTMDYAAADGGAAYTVQIGSGSDGQTLSLTHDERLDDDYHLSFSATSTWDVSVTITDILDNSVTAQFTVPKAGAYFDIEKTGVAVGMRSTGDKNEYDSQTGDLVTVNKKFEVAEDYNSYFYGKMFANGGIEDLFIDWQLVELNSSIVTPGVYGPGKLRIGKIGSHVFMRGSVKSKHGDTICIIPEEFRPKNIDDMDSANCVYFWFAPTTGSNITRLSLNVTSGQLNVEWVKKISDASNLTSDLTWIQVNIDWWLD